MESITIHERPSGSVTRRLVIVTVMTMLLLGTLALTGDPVEAQGPGRKDITLYLHNVTPAAQVGSISTLRTMNTTVGNVFNATTPTSNSLQDDWYLYPVLAEGIDVQGNVTLNIWIKRTALSGNNQGATLRFFLYDYDSSGVNQGTVATTSTAETLMSDWAEYQISAAGVTKYSLAKGHTMRLYFELSGSSSNNYQIAWGDSSYKSRLTIETTGWVAVNDIDVLDYTGVPKVTFLQTEDNKSVTFLANITDPYGGYDIKWVNVTLAAPNGTTLIDTALMTRSKGFFNSYYSEYSYGWNYSGYPTGQYNLTVYAVDNTGYYYRFPTNPGDATYGGHLETNTSSFWIGGMPHNLTVTVQDSQSNTLAGALVNLPVASGLTDASGRVVLKVANGTYQMTVFWQRVQVYSGSVVLAGDASVTVTAAVYSPRIVILDDLGDPVEDAVVFTEHPNGTFLTAFWRTDATGFISWSQMAGGFYRLSVMWRGVEVFNNTVRIDSNGPFSITTMVYTLSISVLDDVGDGVGLAQVVIVNHTTGIVTDSKLTDLSGVAISKLPIGSYDMTVYWRNVVVFDTLVDYLVDASGPLVLRASIHEVDLQVVDTLDVPLATARVVVGFATTSQVHDFGTTNATGVLVTKLPVGYYDLWVYWKDVLVNSTVDLWIDSTGDHTVVAAVYWVDITVLDSRDVPLASAIVTLRHSTAQDFGTIGTDDEGNVSYRLSGGSYSIDIVWQESPVHTGTLDISSNDPWVLNVGVYYLDLTVVDTMAFPLEGAIVTVTNSTTGKGMGIHSTDDEGNTSYRLPTGVYDLGIIWQETEVYTGMRTLDNDIQEVLVAYVYYLFLHVIDSRDAPVEGAQVTVTNASIDRIMGSPVTDAAGDVDLRLPVGSYRIRIVWQETVVYDAVRLVDTNEPVELRVAVYYVDLHVGDTLGVPLEGALITFSNSTTGRSVGTPPTGADGNTSYRVPVGTYDLAVTWQETFVHVSTVVVDTDRALDIVAAVYYGFITALDTTGVPLEGAQVTVTNPDTGRIMGSRATDADGNVTFRLPMDNYTIRVVWRETVVYLVERAVDTNDPMVLTVYVYYAELHVIDTRDMPLAAALVSVTNTSSGRSMGDVTTPEDGIVTFRLPMGEYRFRVVWQETTVFDSMRTINDNGPLTITTHVYYAELRILDSKDAPLELALVSLHNASSDRPMGDRTTGDTGVVTYRIPMGVYSARVTWVDTVVHEDYLTVDSNDPHTLRVDVYYPTFDVVDSQDVAVETALVTVTREDNGRIMASLLTDAAGSVTFRIPVGTYNVAMIWQDTLVHEAVYTVDSNDAFPVDASIFTAELTVVDSRDIGVEFSQVLVTNSTTGKHMASHTADMDGWTRFRLPIGVYEVDVIWQHSHIYSRTWTLTSDLTTDLDAWVYYVQFHIVDGDDIDLGDARVSLANATAGTAIGPVTSDADGLVEFRLPRGAVSMEVEWKAITVYEEAAYEVTSDAYETIDALVFYLTVEVIDSEGAGVGNADVNVVRGGLAVASVVTPKDGTHVFRLPIGDYSVNMSFRTTWHLTRIQIVKGQDVDLSANQTVTFQFTSDEYPLPFYKTNLFWLILLIVLLAILVVFLVYKIRKAPAAPSSVEPAGPIEYTDDDLDDLLENLNDENANGDIVVEAGAAGAVAMEAGADTSEGWDEETPEDEDEHEEEADTEGNTAGDPEEEEAPSEDDDEDLDEVEEEKE